MCIIRQVKQLDLVRQLSLILHFRLLNEWCGLLKISIVGVSWNIEDKILFKEIKVLNQVADRQSAKVSGVGLSAILLWLISGFRFGCSGQKFDRRISIGLTNNNAANKIRNGQILETETMCVGVITILDS